MATEDKATFAVVLEDETSGAANTAANALASLEEKINADTQALGSMRKAMRQIDKAGLGASSTFKKLESRADALKASIGQNQSAFANLGGEFGAGSPLSLAKKKTAALAEAAKKSGAALKIDLADKAKKAGEATKFLGSQVSAAGGPIAGMAGSLSKLGPLLSNPIGIALALAAAFLALAAAVVVATVAMLKFAIAQSGARRSEALQIEGLNTLRQQWGRATASVSEFQNAIDRASDSTNIGRGTLQTYARQLSRAGLRGDALTEALEAMGIAAQVQGDRGAQRFRALALNARLTGGSVRDLAADYRNRLGPIARRQMLEIDNQTERLRRSLDRIFSGLRIEPFLESLDEMLSLFSQSTETGKALKAIVEALLQPLIDATGVVGPVVRRFFQGFVIGGLIATIGILRVKSALADLFGDDFAADINLAKAALFLGIGAFVAFAVVVGIALVVFAALVAVVASFLAVFLAVPLALIAAGVALGFALGVIVDFFQETDFGQLATEMIDGLVNGIRTGAARLAQQMRILAVGASSAFRSALGISSPSSVFADFGMNIAQGAAQGIEAGTPAVEDATSGLVDAPTGGGLGGSTSISIGDVIISATETSDPRELAMQFRDELASILEGLNTELGAPT